jgi:lipopolysaccharide transport system ATP-binding protein
MAAIDNLCPRTIWISNGQVQGDGPTKEIAREYLASYDSKVGQSLELGSVRDRQGNGQVRFQRMEILGTDGELNPVVRSGDGFRVRMHYECYRDIPNLHFGLRIFSNMGQLITDAHTWTTCQPVPLAPTGPGCIEIEIDSLNLMPDTYYLGIWASAFHEWNDVLDNVVKLEIEPSDYYGTGRGVEARFGTIFLPFRWREVAAANGFTSPTNATTILSGAAHVEGDAPP